MRHRRRAVKFWIYPPYRDTDTSYTAPKYPAVALRTNLLLPLLNAGVEVPIDNHWSIEADWNYPWFWRAADHKNCFELLYASLGVRYWFGSKHSSSPDNVQYRLQGHSLGVYADAGYYDFERNWHGYQGNGWSSGLSYLYAIPVAHGKLHLEFELAAGAVWSLAQPYNVKVEGGRLIREADHKKQFLYFGPTKIGVSLVVPIFRTINQESR